MRIRVAGADRAHDRLLGEVHRVVGRPADADADDPGRARLAARADDRLEHEPLDPVHPVGGHAHLQEAHVLGARALRDALDVQPVPVGDELPVDDRQPVADVRAGVLARDRVHRVRAQRVLDGRARGAVAEALVDPGRMEREVLADPAVVDGDTGVLADEVLLRVGDADVAVDRLEDAPARHGRLPVARGGERVAEVLRDVLQRPDVEVGGGVLDGVLEVGGDRAHARAFSAAARPARRPKTTHSSSELPIMRFRPCVPPAISPQAKSPSSVVSASRVDHEAAVLVVEDGVGEEPLGQRVDACAAVAAQHVRQRHLGVGLGDPRRVEEDGRAAVGRLDALALGDLVDDRLRDDVARPERVRELLAVGVQEHRAVGARRLGDRVALHVRRPGAAVRVVLQRIEVARLCAELERDAASPRRWRSDGWSRARLAPAPPRSSGRPPPRTTVAASITCSPQVARQPFPAGLEAAAAARSRTTCPCPPPTPRAAPFVIAWPGAVADLEQPLRARRRRSGRAGSRRSRA